MRVQSLRSLCLERRKDVTVSFELFYFFLYRSLSGIVAYRPSTIASVWSEMISEISIPILV